MELLGAIMPAWNASGYIVLARLRQAMGDEAGAREAVETARQLARSTETAVDDVYLEVQAAGLALSQHDLVSAERWASRWTPGSVPMTQPQGGDVEALVQSHLFHVMVQTTLVRLHLARGQPGQALDTLERLRGTSSPGCPESGNPVEFMALRALANSAQGRTAAALSDLGSALRLAEPEGYVRTFIDEGEPMRELLREAAKRGVATEYATRLLGALEGRTRLGPLARASARVVQPQPALLAERLTEREVEVLRLLQTSLTTPEIASEMGIAASTVRTFVKNLYGKLGVHRRLDAIDQARELGLLQA
jgi:LuxR family maltose regulon positive regulatory protein